MRTELNTYIILLIATVALAVFLIIRKSFKKVLLISVLIILLTFRVVSLKTANEYAKKYAEETEEKKENSESEDQQEITIKMPKINLFPTVNYYDKSTKSEEEE